MKLSAMLNIPSEPKHTAALMVRNDQDSSASFTAEAEALKNNILAGAASIKAVSDVPSQECAVKAQIEIRRCLTAVEDARVACKAPFIETGRAIDGKAKAFRMELEKEELRIARLIGDFQALTIAKVRAAETARKLELEKLEEARQVAISKAESHEEIENINADFCDQSATFPNVAAPKVSGQIVCEEWNIIVTDVLALAKAYPSCVKIEPCLREIKCLLDMGIKVPGISANNVVVSRVRVAPQMKTIEV